MTWRRCLRPCVAGAQDGDSPRAVGLLDHLWALAARCFVRRPCREPLPLLRLSTRSLRNVFSACHVPALCRLCARWEHLTAPAHVKSSAADPSGGASCGGVWVGGDSGSFLSFLVSLLCAPLRYSLGTSCVPWAKQQAEWPLCVVCLFPTWASGWKPRLSAFLPVPRRAPGTEAHSVRRCWR